MMICLSPWLGKFCSMQFFSICLCVCLCFLPCCAVKKMSALILLYMLCLGLLEICQDFKMFFTNQRCSSPSQIHGRSDGRQSELRSLNKIRVNPRGTKNTTARWIEAVETPIKLFDTDSRWWFEMFFIFTPTWGNDPIWLIFFKWVETAN